MGRIPFLTDFEKYGSVDALNILSSYGSYHAFLSKKEKEYTQTFDAKGERLLTYLSKIAAPGKRASETELLETVMSGTEDPLSEFGSKHPDFTDIEMNNLKAVFDGSFYNTNGKPDYAPNLFEECSKIPDDALREQVTDILELGKQNNLSKYSETYGDTNFVLNAMYTYEDVCRLMNWKANVIGQSIGGYKFDETTNTFSVFINYVKGENVVESQRYEDRFENRRTLTALSKSTEGIESKNMTRVRDSEKNGTKIHLFVRKNKDDKGSKEFYYLGELIFETFLNDEKPVMIRYGLKHEVRSDLFDYFES
jgi:hypothetical protein